MYTLFLALRYLRSHRIVYWSIAAVAVGILSVLVVSSVMAGFARDIRARIRGLSSDITIESRPGLWIRDYPKVLDAVRAAPHVKAAAPRIEIQGWLKGSTRKVVTAIGIDLDAEKTASRLPEFFAAERKKWSWDHDAGERRKAEPVVLGTGWGGFEGLKVSFITVADATTPSVLPVELEVVGHFKTGMSEYDYTHIVLPLETAQKWLQLESVPRVNRIVVSLDDYARNGKAARAAIVEAIHQVRPCTKPANHALGQCGLHRVETWEESKSILLGAVSVEKSLQFIILFLVVIVAGFNITAIYTLMVKAKTRDIGVVMALGGTERGVGRVFLLCGLLCGVIGAIIGVTGGLGIAFNINELEEFLKIWSRELHRSGHRVVTATTGGISLVCLMFWWWRLGDPWQPSKKWWGGGAASAGAVALFYAFAWAGAKHLHESLPPILPFLTAMATAGLVLSATGCRWLAERLQGLLVAGFLHLLVMLQGVAATIAVGAALAVALIGPFEIFPRDIYYLDRIPVEVDPARVIATVAGSMLVCLLFSLYPAAKAAHYDPVVAIRDE